jgi:hypothetical protein
VFEEVIEVRKKLNDRTYNSTRKPLRVKSPGFEIVNLIDIGRTARRLLQPEVSPACPALCHSSPVSFCKCSAYLR